MKFSDLKYHYRPAKGWINDPNGLVYFKGYYHVFYQHSPNYEKPWNEPMHWGHTRTTDFLDWEELPVALYPDNSYDNDGCWSGTATVKDDTLFLIYTSVHSDSEVEKKQTISVAYSKDGINFEKYEKNPVIECYPDDGGPDFRDPAVCLIDRTYYCVIATGNPQSKTARLLLYKSNNLFDWEYEGIMAEWKNCRYAECPSLQPAENGKYLLTVSVCPLEGKHYFSVMYGSFINGKFNVEHTSEVDKGPDQYAGQVFRDHKGRNILISWMPGWSYSGYKDKDIGCMSAPRQLKLQNGKITSYPIDEFHHLLKSTDECLKLTDDGFIIERENREPVIHKGEIRDLRILRDSYLAEIFVNGGEEVYSVLL